MKRKIVYRILSLTLSAILVVSSANTAFFSEEIKSIETVEEIETVGETTEDVSEEKKDESEVKKLATEEKVTPSEEATETPSYYEAVSTDAFESATPSATPLMEDEEEATPTHFEKREVLSIDEDVEMAESPTPSSTPIEDKEVTESATLSNSPIKEFEILFGEKDTEVNKELEKISLEGDIYEYKESPSSTYSLKYIINEDGETVTITGYTGESDNGLTIPREINGYTVTIIATSAFSGQAVWPTEEWVGDFSGVLTIPNTITTIGDGAFSACRGLTGNLSIPNSVTTIGGCAFSDCSGLTGDLVIPDSVTTIGGNAFAGCYGINGSLKIGSSLTQIYEATFYGLTNISDIYFPDTVEYISPSAFKQFSNITYTVEFINAEFHFVRGSYAEKWYKDRGGIVKYYTLTYTVNSDGNTVTVIGYEGEANEGFIIPPTIDGRTVTKIGENAFYECRDIEGDLTIADTVTDIGAHAFWGCSGFDGNLVIGNGVKSIGSGAFQGTQFKTITIGNSVETIGEYAFSSNQNATDITIPASVTSIGTDAFKDNVPGGGMEFTSAIFHLVKGSYAENWYDENGGYVSPDSVSISVVGETEEYNAIIGEQLDLTISPSISEYKTHEINICFLEGAENIETITEQINDKISVKCLNPGTVRMYVKYNGVASNSVTININPAILTLYYPDGTTDIFDANSFGHKLTGLSDKEKNYEGKIFVGWFTEKYGQGLQISENSFLGRELNNLYAYYKTAKSEMVVAPIENLRYSGDKLAPPVKVFYGDNELNAGTDYTVTYANNINACDKDDEEVLASMKPVAIVTGKGNLAGRAHVYFTIEKADISDISIDTIYTIEDTKVQKLLPVVMWNGKNLIIDKDFTVTYPDSEENAYKAAGSYTVTVTGIGNYKGSVDAIEVIAPSTKTSINKLTVKAITAQTYDGIAKRPSLTITKGTNAILTEGIDYYLSYENNVLPGTATVTITGMGDYIGVRKVNFKINGVDINSVTVSYPSIVSYTGDEVTFDKEQLKLYIKATRNAKQVDLIKDADYTVSYLSNTNVGTATIILTGINKYTGAVKKTFKITPLLSEGNLDVQFKDGTEEYPFVKGGVKPSVTVKYQGNTLTEGTDYTVKYANNVKISDKDVLNAPTVIITGKRNFTKTVRKNFSIIPAPLSQATATAGDVIYNARAGKWKAGVAVIDKDGKALKAGIDYEKSLVYKYADTNKVVGEGDVPEVETMINVEITGKGMYYGTICTEYRIASKSITNAICSVESQYYSGNEIKLDNNQIIVKVNGVYLRNWEYEIVSYENNINVGRASVTIHGVGNYGGYKKVPYSIIQNSINPTIIFDGNGATSGKMKPIEVDNKAEYSWVNGYVKAGYQLVGWNLERDGTGKPYYGNISKNECEEGIVLYAQWKPIEYSISYILNGGKLNVQNPQSYTAESNNVFLNQAIREHYYFRGWYLDPKFKKEVTSLSDGSIGDIKLYAKWVPYVYTVIYDGNGSTSGAMPDQVCNYDKVYRLTPNMYKRNQFKFVEWNTKDDGTGTSYKNLANIFNLSGVNNSTVRLYAIWEYANFPITNNVEYVDTSNKNGVYELFTFDWILDATLIDSKGNIIDKIVNPQRKSSSIPRYVRFSPLQEGTYYITYHSCSYTTQFYYQPIYLDGVFTYEVYTPASRYSTTYIKLQVVELPQELDVTPLDEKQNNILYVSEDTPINIHVDGMNWIYSCKISKDNSAIYDKSWTQKGQNNNNVSIGRLKKGTYELTGVVYPSDEEAGFEYRDNGQMIYVTYGIYYPKVDDRDKKVWSKTIIVK